MNVTTIEAKSALSASILRLLEERGWSRYRLSQITGISQMTLGNIVNGIHEPRVSMLKTIADAFGTTIDEMLSDDSRKSRKSRRVPA